MEPAWPPAGGVEWVLLAGLVATALLGIWSLVRRAAAFVRRLVDFLEDWNGRPDRPGHDAQPGVMQQLADHGRRLAVVESEVQPNGGSSLKDQITGLVRRADTNAAGIARLVEGQAEAAAAAKAARDKAAEVHDELHNWVEEGQVREQAYLASLAELGIDLQPQPRRDPHARTRRDDDEPEDQ